MAENDVSPEEIPQDTAVAVEHLGNQKNNSPGNPLIKFCKKVTKALVVLRQLDLPRGPVIARRIVWSVIIAAAGALGTAMFSLIWQRLSPPIIDYEVDVRQDDAKGSPIPDVEVDLGVNGVASQKTNIFGKAVFSNLSSHLLRKKGTIALHKEGFRAYTTYASSLGNNDTPLTLVMVAEKSSLPEPELKGVNQPSAPDSSATADPSPPASAPSQIVKTYSSGPQLSGVGGDKSPWYSLCSDPILGYRVLDTKFSLTGDRACNAWSDCEVDTGKSTATVSCWRFRMQGHSEAFRPFGASGSAQSFSTGVLTVKLGKD